MAAERLITPEQEAEQTRPELQLVPDQSEQGIRDDTQNVRLFLEGIQSAESVPATVEEAEQKATHIKAIENALVQRIEAGSVHVDDAQVKVLHATVKEGANLWRLDKDARDYYHGIKKARAAEDLNEDAAAGHEEMTADDFAALQKEAEARLRIDHKLYRREQRERKAARAAEQSAIPSEPAQQQVDNKRASREQGPAGTAEAIVVTEQNVETSAQPVVKSRARDAARREQGAPEQAQKTADTETNRSSGGEATVTPPELDADALAKLGLRLTKNGRVQDIATGKFHRGNNEQLRELVKHADEASQDMQGSREDYEAAVRAETEALIDKEVNHISLREAGRSKLAQKQNPVIAKAVRDAAIAKVKEAGHDVSHLERVRPDDVPEHAWVALKSDAEKDSFLQHWNSVDAELKGRQITAWAKAAEAQNSKHGRPDDFPEEVWITLSEDEKDNALSQWEVVSKEDWQKIVDGWAGQKPEDIQAEFLTAERAGEVVPVPLDDTSKKGLRKRFSNRVAWAGGQTSAAAYKLREYFTDDEKGSRRRKVGVVIGAASAIAAGVVIAKLGHGSSGSADTGFVKPHDLLETKGNNGHGFTSVKIHHGETIWGHEQELHPRRAAESYSEWQHRILTDTKKDLRHNHLTFADARHLNDGEEVELRR